MTRIVLEIPAETRRNVQELSALGFKVGRAIDQGLGIAVKLAAGNIVSKHLSGQSLKRRTGNLARAVDGWKTGKYEGMVGARDQSAAEAYAWLLTDQTKLITPQRGKYLAIPIGQNLTAAGVARYDSPVFVPGGFFIKTKSGKVLFGITTGTSNQSRIGSKKSKTGKFIPLFALVTSVTVTGSDALAKGVLESLDEMTDAINNEIERAVS